jgi:hypothetical protein
MFDHLYFLPLFLQVISLEAPHCILYIFAWYISHFTNVLFFQITENVPPVALNDDRVVEIQGEPLDAHKAVELIASHLRKFLVDRSVLPLFETQASCILLCNILVTYMKYLVII